MMALYLFYPTDIATIHKNPNCNLVQMRNKQNQRAIHIDIENLLSTLNDFKKNCYPLGGKVSNNDLWMSIDFGNEEFEEVVLKFIISICQKNLKRNKNKWNTINIHC